MSDLTPDAALDNEHGTMEAWGIIANAYGGNWDDAPAEWREAAERWRDWWLHRSHDDTKWRLTEIREQALTNCGDRIARSQRHVIPGKMPAHSAVYFSDDDVRLDDVLMAVETVMRSENAQDARAQVQGFGTNGGVRCDTTSGPCACKAWH